jgi:hypothetical protein
MNLPNIEDKGVKTRQYMSRTEYGMEETNQCEGLRNGYLEARYTDRFSDSERSLKLIVGKALIVVAITMFLRVFELTRHVLD